MGSGVHCSCAHAMSIRKMLSRINSVNHNKCLTYGVKQNCYQCCIGGRKSLCTFIHFKVQHSTSNCWDTIIIACFIRQHIWLVERFCDEWICLWSMGGIDSGYHDLGQQV